jgi:hypothetical protein
MVSNKTIVEKKIKKNKTSMGMTDNRFDFLNFHFFPERLLVSQKTLDSFFVYADQFYEQEQGEFFGSPCLDRIYCHLITHSQMLLDTNE